MKSYWQNLNDRDRWALGIGVAAVVVYLIYLLIVSPILTALDEKKRLHVEKRQTLSWMQQIRVHKKSITQPKVLSNAQLLSLLATQLKKSEFQPFPYQLQQTGAGDIQLSFDSVPLMPFLSWLQGLNQKYAFIVQQFKAQRLDTEGLAEVSVILSAKHGH